jgi:hypothetical protein
MMTRDAFRHWAARAKAIFAGDGPTDRTDREHAESVRPHDPALADLYVRCAEAHEAVRAHLMRPT